MAKKFVRIAPSNQREVHCTMGIIFRKERGWYEVEESLAASLMKERMSDRNPASPPIFEVAASLDEAAARLETERVAEEAARRAAVAARIQQPVPITAEALSVPRAEVPAEAENAATLRAELQALRAANKDLEERLARASDLETRLATLEAAAKPRKRPTKRPAA